MILNIYRNLIVLVVLIPNLCLSQSFYKTGLKGTNDVVISLLADTITNTIYAGGQFSKADNIKSNCIAKLNSNIWDSTRNQFTIPPFDQIRTITKSNNILYVGGIFGVFDTLNNLMGLCLAKWNSQLQYWDTLPNSKIKDGVEFLYDYNNELYVCGTFDSVGTIYSAKIARFDGTNWHSYPPIETVNGYGIDAATHYKGELYVGGNFGSQPGTNIKDIAKWDGVQWQPLGSGLSGASTFVLSLEVFQNKLIVGGYFSTATGDAGNSIMAWDGSAWSPLGQGTNGFVRCMTNYNGELWVGGGFTSAGGLPASYIAKWDGVQWQSVGASFNNVVTSMAVLGNDLYIGGAFFTVLNGDTASYIVRYNPITGFESISHKEYQLEVKPNPAKEYISLKYTGKNIDLNCIQIFNPIGENKFELKISNNTNLNKIDVSQFSSGIYFVRLLYDKGSMTAKFYKE